MCEEVHCLDRKRRSSQAIGFQAGAERTRLLITEQARLGALVPAVQRHASAACRLGNEDALQVEAGRTARDSASMVKQVSVMALSC